MQTEALKVISADFSSLMNRHSSGSPVRLMHRASNKTHEIKTKTHLQWFDSGLTHTQTHRETHTL